MRTHSVHQDVVDYHNPLLQGNCSQSTWDQKGSQNNISKVWRGIQGNKCNSSHISPDEERRQCWLGIGNLDQVQFQCRLGLVSRISNSNSLITKYTNNKLGLYILHSYSKATVMDLCLTLLRNDACFKFVSPVTFSVRKEAE